MKVATGGAWKSGMLLLGALTAAGTAYVVWQKLSKSRKPPPLAPESVEDNGVADRSIKQAVASDKQKQATSPQQSTECILQESERLKQAYSEMSQKFLTDGLNVELVSSTRQYFSGLESLEVTSSPGSRIVAPKRYVDEWPGGTLAPNAVRLIVLPLDPDSKISSSGESVTRDVLKQLSFVKDVFRNIRSGYHVTIYHTSKMMYPCPDATHPTGGVTESTAPSERPGPTQARCPPGVPAPCGAGIETIMNTPGYCGHIENELQICSAFASACGQIQLEFERVVFTDTGTLLLTWIDPSGRIEPLRAKLRAEFPGALKIPQSDIVHISLLRVLCVQQLDVYIRQKIDAVCTKWTSRLKGTTWEPDTLMHVCEECFSTIEGQHSRFVLQ